MGGEFSLVRFDHRPTWYFRFYLPASAGQRRGYIKRSLKTQDRNEAERRAYEEWRKLKTLQEDGGTVTSKTLQEVMDDWIDASWQRVVTGEIQEGTWKSKNLFFKNQLRLFFQAKGLKRITDLQVDTFDDYRYWRMTEGWKYSKKTNGRRPPTDGTVNSEIGLINEWFNNHLIPKGYVRRKPKIRTKTLDQDDLAANPPIPLKEWEKIWRWMESWSESDAKGVNRPQVHYWRNCFRHYLLVAYNSGARPTELVGRFNKRQEQLDRGLTWGDVEIQPRTRWSPKANKEIEDKPVSILDIRKTKTGVPREVPCLAATHLIRWKKFVDDWRSQNGFPPVQSTDLVFVNPGTGKPFSYTCFSRTWDQIRKQLADSLTGHYTLYSTRSSYVTNQLEEGIPSDYVCKLTGHAYEVMKRHYERMQMRNLIPEVTKRTYGKRYENAHGAYKLV
jgi:hypothetical protein